MTLQEFKDFLFEQHKGEFVQLLDSKVADAERALSDFDARTAAERQSYVAAVEAARAARTEAEPPAPVVEETPAEVPAEV